MLAFEDYEVAARGHPGRLCSKAGAGAGLTPGLGDQAVIAVTLLSGIFEVGGCGVPGGAVLEVNQSIQHFGAELGAIKEDSQHCRPDRRENTAPARGVGRTQTR